MNLVDRYGVDIRPSHVMAGLGGADRALLSTSLALYDDSSWRKRLSHHYDRASKRIRRWTTEEIKKAESELRSSQQQWLESDWSDDELRFLLWSRLRDSLGLPPRLSGSLQGCGMLADDLAARLIHFLDPPGLKKSGKRWLRKTGWLEGEDQAITLADIVLPLLDELLQNSPAAEEFPSDPAERREALSAAVSALGRLTRKEQRRLLDELEVNKLNDSALVKALAIGGGLGALGVGVSAAGFSAYILAAQASAFIPFVSGPGLVSLVAVLSNPITIIGAFGGGLFWFLRSAKHRINANVTARITAMLAIQGLQSGTASMSRIRDTFSVLDKADPGTYPVSKKVLSQYVSEWQLIEPAVESAPTAPKDFILDKMERPIRFDLKDKLPSAPQPGQTGKGGELKAAGALGTVTVGEVLYSLAAIDPRVIQAADFSRIAEIDDRVDFSIFAQELLEGDGQGGFWQLKGYVAEQAVAAELARRGHSVELPDSSTQPGWDLKVDSEPVQVKFRDNVQGITEHFEKYDYPVIANSELQGEIPEGFEDRVFFIEGLSDQLVEQISEASLEAGADVMTPGMPAMVGIISVARGVNAFRSGQVTGRQALEQIMLDGTVRIGLFGAGGAVGATAGLMLFGPAGAWVIGAGAPILAQMQTSGVSQFVKSKVKGDAHRYWENESHDACLTSITLSDWRQLKWPVGECF